MNWLALDVFLTRVRPRRRALSLVIDGFVIALCWNITYLFRLGFERWINARPTYDVWVLCGLLAIYLSVFVLVGVPRGMWRFSGFGEIKRLTVACAIAGVLCATLVMLAKLTQVPRAVLALHPVVSLMGLTLVRIGYRMLYEHMRARIAGTAVETRRALVLGAGDAARRLIAGIQHDGWVIVGLLDDDPGKRGARVSGLPVLGPVDKVTEFAKTHGITHIVIAMPTATPAQRRRAIDFAIPTRLPVLTVPGAQELREGTHQRVRDIEPADLLGRQPVQLGETDIAACLSGKTVLITGAGGSIGSELCRQVARFRPSKIVLYEQSEFALYTVEQTLSEAFPHLALVSLIGDVKDAEHLRVTFARFAPQIVFHAAAYKHVPLMEQGNSLAALRNNTLGTFNVAKAAAFCGVERFVLVSTDKAVNPTNVMGASKRAAEVLLSSIARQSTTTRFIAVRFGNVLGSSGSVIPKFKDQIARGGPVTVTHAEVTRYFMTIPEAAQLVLQAAAMADNGQVYVLDMGEPVRIVDVARDMIRLAGYRDDEIEIVFTGLRPGEKLYEELLADSDRTVPSAHPLLRVAILREEVDAAKLSEAVVAANALPADIGDEAVRDWLQTLVPEYQPEQ